MEWTHYQGPVPALTWFEIEFNSFISIKSIYVIAVGAWRLYEFQFWSGADGYQLLPPEDYIVDNNNVTGNALSSPLQRKIVVGPNSRIHCCFRKCIYGGRISHVYYAYSDDYGKTWTVEDPVPGLHDAQYTPSIAVDSSGNPHIIFRDQPSTVHGLVHTGRYIKRSANGTWALSNFYVGAYVTIGGGPTPPPFNFAAGDEVEGAVSEVKKTIAFVFTIGAGSKTLGFITNSSGLIEGEALNNKTQPGNQCWYEYDIGPSSGTAVAIGSSNRLRIVGSMATCLWYWIQPSPNHIIGHSEGKIGNGSLVAIDIDPSAYGKIVYFNVNSYYDAAGDTLICTGTSDAPTYFSIASDADGNVHLVLAQTGLGGDFPEVLNIKYYKRINLAWSGPIHITDVNYEQRYSSISIDTQNRIHVMWQGKGWGTYPGKFSVLLRTYENGAWGAVQIILNNDKDQGEYGPSLLHAWHPNSNRLKNPVYIFAKQDSWKIQFGGTLPVAIPPDNLLCEQTKNPTNVSDPQPEFSAIYW
ncbi:hypothetical protein ES703_48899 [subsurface metagenome]